MNVVESRNLFVDSSATQRGESRSVTLSVPQGMMECQDHQTLRVTLASFQMRKNFYNVNQHNNTFFVFAKTGVPATPVAYHQVEISPGDYQYRNQQLDAIQSSLATQMNASVVVALKAMGATAPTCVSAWQANTGRWVLEIKNVPATWTDIKLVSFKIPDYRGTPQNLITKAVAGNSGFAFQSSSDLLGGCPHTKIDLGGTTDLEQYDELTSMFVSTAPLAAQDQSFVGLFKAALSTDDSIYVRTNLQNTGFQTAGFDTGGDQYPQIRATQILAKVSLANLQNRSVFFTTDRVVVASPPAQGSNQPTSTYEAFDTEIIDYQDKGDLVYSLRLTNRNISEFNLSITDRLGRLLPAISNEQVACNNMSWTATLRIDVLE